MTQPRTIIISANTSWNLAHFRPNLIAALRRRGFRVVAVAPRDSYSQPLEEQADEYIPLDFHSASISPLHDAKLFFRFVRVMRRVRPALFLGFTIKPNIYGSLAARLLRITVINNVSGLGTAFIKQSFITRVTTAMYRQALKRSAKIFFQNKEDREQFAGAQIVRLEQTEVLPGSGVDLQRFAPALLPADEPFCFLLVARLLWDKGVREFVDASLLVREHHPSARFLIIGPVDVDNRTAVPRATLNEWVERGIIEHHGAADDVRPFIARANCIVLPSYREGLPRSLLEASAMGRPIVATDVPGVRDVVDDKVTGILCEVRSARSLASAMLSMMALSRDERAEMGRAGRHRVEREFDIKLVTQSYLQAIDAALQDADHSNARRPI
jgi:glycosyltransferase involved in cell wall biosynthesis